LATIANFLDNQAATAVCKTSGLTGDASHCWVGGQHTASITDYGSEKADAWEWLTGIPFEYSNWGAGQPNGPDGGTSVQGGIAIMAVADASGYRSEGEWQDKKKADPRPAVYECPVQKKEYVYIKDLKTFSDHNLLAIKIGCEVASITSKADNDQATRQCKLGGTGSDLCWIGGELEAKWIWSDDTPFVYTNWAVGQPNGAGAAAQDGITLQTTDQDGIVLQAADGAWQDKPTNQNKAAVYVCPTCGTESRYDFQGECTTTGGCQNMYPGKDANDCFNSKNNGVCLCGINGELCGCL